MNESIETVRRSRHVAEIWLNRPAVRNAFNAQVIADLRDAFGRFASEPDLRVILLGGRGPTFCAGADLGWMREMADFSWDQNRDDARALADMLWTIYQCPVPIVARIHGDCYAGGVGLASVCDVAVAAVGVDFCLSEARLGLLPATISPYVLRAMGEQAARRYFVTAERFNATRAFEIGMVHEVCAADALDARIEEILATIVANGPMSVRACKRLVQDVAGAPLDAMLRDETARRIADIRASDEGREGIQSFLQKRRPAWIAS